MSDQPNTAPDQDGQVRRTIDLNPTVRQVLYLVGGIGAIAASLAASFGWLDTEQVTGILAALGSLHMLAAGKTDTSRPVQDDPPAPAEPAPAEPEPPAA